MELKMVKRFRWTGNDGNFRDKTTEVDIYKKEIRYLRAAICLYQCEWPNHVLRKASDIRIGLLIKANQLHMQKVMDN